MLSKQKWARYVRRLHDCKLLGAARALIRKDGAGMLDYQWNFEYTWSLDVSCENNSRMRRRLIKDFSPPTYPTAKSKFLEYMMPSASKEMLFS